jgi:hypothetical protein
MQYLNAWPKLYLVRLSKARATMRSRIGVYIGDGATLRRTMVRIKDGVLIGHAPCDSARMVRQGARA